MKAMLTEIWLWAVAVFFTVAAIATFFAWVGAIVLFIGRITE